MLTKYRKTYKKIAMGLLSFIPGERELKTLQQTVQRYEEHPDCQLYLLKKEGDFVGLIGLEIAENHFTVCHASITPCYRGEGLGHAMVAAVQQLMGARELRATAKTEAFLAKCREALPVVRMEKVTLIAEERQKL